MTLYTRHLQLSLIFFHDDNDDVYDDYDDNNNDENVDDYNNIAR